jgi:hypothetical protein
MDKFGYHNDGDGGGEGDDTPLTDQNLLTN